MPFVAAQSSSNTSHCLEGETAISRGVSIVCSPGDVRPCPNGTFVGVDNQGRDICKALTTSTICADPNGIQDNRKEDCVTYRENEIVFTSEQLENRRKLLGVGTVELEQLENSDKLSEYAADESEQKINPNKVVDTQSGETPDYTILINAPVIFMIVVSIIVVSILVQKSRNRKSKEKVQRSSEVLSKPYSAPERKPSSIEESRHIDKSIFGGKNKPIDKTQSPWGIPSNSYSAPERKPSSIEESRHIDKSISEDNSKPIEKAQRPLRIPSNSYSAPERKPSSIEESRHIDKSISEDNSKPIEKPSTVVKVVSGRKQDYSYVILVDTNVCIDAIDNCKNEDERPRQQAIKKFFQEDKRFLVIEDVYNELDSITSPSIKKLKKRIGEKKLAEFLDSIYAKDADRTDNVKKVIENQTKFAPEHAEYWSNKMKEYEKTINGNQRMEEHRKRWRMVKMPEEDLIYPYVFVMSKGKGINDLGILGRAAYLADSSEYYKIILLTSDNDFIVFANKIRTDFKVHVLSGWWYFDNLAKGQDGDLIDRLTKWGGVDFDKHYGTLDEEHKAKIPGSFSKHLKNKK